MKNIRIGNDILLNFPIILENSTIEQIRKMNFKVFVMPSKPDVTESSTPETPADKYKYRICDNHEMYNWKFDEFKKHHKHACELSHKIVEVEDDKYVFEAYFPAYHQHVLGKYDVIIFGNHKEVGQCVCDQKEFVNLVEHSEDADQVFTEDAEPILVLHPLMIEYGKLNEIEQAEKDRVRAEQYRVNNEINRETAELLRRNSEQGRVLAEQERNTKQGDLSKLITPTKTDLVSAINEAYNHGGGDDGGQGRVMTFGGIINECVVQQASLANTVAPENILYVKSLGFFVAKVAGDGTFVSPTKYYMNWRGADEYNEAGEDGIKAKDSNVFIDLSTGEIAEIKARIAQLESEGGGDKDCVKYINLSKLPEDGIFKCDGAFEVGIGMEEEDEEGVMHRIFLQASHKRIDDSWTRFDCFMHYPLSDKLSGTHVLFSIIVMGADGQCCLLGLLAHYPVTIVDGEIKYANRLTINGLSTEVEEIAGKNADEWADYILPMFGDESHPFDPIAPVQEYVSVVDLATKTSGSFVLSNKPFLCKCLIDGKRPLVASHYLYDPDINYRYDCFYHKGDGLFSGLYSIIKLVDQTAQYTNYQFLGFLGRYYNGICFLSDPTLENKLETIGGKTVDYWKARILPLLGEDDGAYEIELVRKNPQAEWEVAESSARYIATHYPFAIRIQWPGVYQNTTLYRVDSAFPPGSSENIIVYVSEHVDTYLRVTITYDSSSYGGTVEYDESTRSILVKFAGVVDKQQLIIEGLGSELGEKVASINGNKPDEQGNINVKVLTEEEKEQIAQALQMKTTVDETAQKVNAVARGEFATPDFTTLPFLCGQPMMLFGAGTPQEAIVPDNWNQYNPETGEGYQWNGMPSALGQVYINTSASTNGRYTAVPYGYGNLKWANF